MSNHSTTLSLKHIIATLVLFLGVPLLTAFVDIFVDNIVISFTFAANLSAFINVLLNWELIEIHTQRFIQSFDEEVFFIGVGLVIFILVSMVRNQLTGSQHLMDYELIRQYSFYVFPAIVAYTLSFTINYILAFKSLSDRLNIQDHQIPTMILTCLLFTFLFSIFYMENFSIAGFLTMFSFYLVITVTISYLYNQTGNLVCPFICFTAIVLVSQILHLL